MKVLLTILFASTTLLCSAQHDHDHAGHDHAGHSHGEPVNTSKATYFSISESTKSAEYVLHYEPFQKNQRTKLKLYVSDWETNVPIDSAKMIIKCEELDKRFSFSKIGPGIYEITASFPDNKAYELSIDLKAPFEDRIHIFGIEPGKSLEEEVTEEEGEHLFTWVTWLFLGLGFLFGVVLTIIAKQKAK